MLKSVLLLLFTMSLYGERSEAAPAIGKDVVVKWQGDSIRLGDFSEGLSLRRASDPVVSSRHSLECDFQGMKTRCVELYRVNQNTERHPYGSNMRLVAPIAVLPIYTRPDVDVKSTSSSATGSFDGFEVPLKFKDQAPVVAKLPGYKFATIPQEQIENILNIYSGLQGPETQTFSYADETVGGNEALVIWKSLLDKLPSRKCWGDDDSCSVVLEGKNGLNDTLVYCEILYTTVGYGYPIRCNTVALIDHGKWRVLAYDTPEQCWGCGAVDGAFCIFQTKLSPKEIVPLVVDVFKKEKTNMTLTVAKSSDKSITLTGKKIGVDSKWKNGYFEKSAANYTIDTLDEAGAGYISIGGVYQLLINSDPSTDENDSSWTEFSDIHWFQGQIINLLQKHIVDRIATKAEPGSPPQCSNEF